MLQFIYTCRGKIKKCGNRVLENGQQKAAAILKTIGILYIYINTYNFCEKNHVKRIRFLGKTDEDCSKLKNKDFLSI